MHRTPAECSDILIYPTSCHRQWYDTFPLIPAPCRTAAHRLQPSGSARLNLSRNASPAPSAVMPRVSGDQVSLQHQQPLQPPVQQGYLSEGGLGGSGYLQAPQQQQQQHYPPLQQQQPVGSTSPPGALGPSRLSNTSRRASGEVSAASLATTYASVVGGGGQQQASISPRPSGVPAGGSTAGSGVVPTSNTSAGGAASSTPGSQQTPSGANENGAGSTAPTTAFAADAAGTVAVPGSQQQGPGIAPSPSYNQNMGRSMCERSGGRSGAQTPAELSASGKQPTIHELIAAMREVHEQEAMLRSSSMRITPGRSSAANVELQAAASAALAAANSMSSDQGTTTSAGTTTGAGSAGQQQLQQGQVPAAGLAAAPGGNLAAQGSTPSSGPLAKLSAVGSMVQQEFTALLDRAMSGASYHS
jgi:hypothetical protein